MIRFLKQLFGARGILQAALDWDAEYRAINHLGKNGPYWTWRANRELKMTGRYAPPGEKEGGN